MEASKFELPFAKKVQLNEETYTFYFDRKSVKFDYLAGQYNRVTLNIDNPDDRGSSRYFTMSSSPTDEFITITTKIIKSTFKLTLNSLSPGERITFFGPFGDMVQDDTDMSPKIFLAGGIGLTPAHSMLRFIDAKKLNVKFNLFVSFSNSPEVLFYDELKKIEKNNPSVSVVYVLTKEDKAGYENGRISKEMITKYAPDFDSSKVFMSGPSAMVEALQNTIKDMGVGEDKIFTEDFSGY